MRIPSPVVRRRAALWCLLAAPLTAAALEGGAGASDPQAGTPAAAVGSLYAAQRLLSGVLIDRQWVLTAAHAVNGAVPAEVVFRSPLAGGFVARARAVHVHPGFVTGQVDLALVQLERPAPAALPPAPLYTGPLLGHIVHLVSHGGSTTLITTGENRVDALQPDAAGRPLLYLFDQDGPDLSSNVIGPAVPANGTLGAGREATLAAGDSGSAAFVVLDGRWGLAGINTFQATVTPKGGGPVGRLAGGIWLAPQAAWIARVLRGEAADAKP